MKLVRLFNFGTTAEQVASSSGEIVMNYRFIRKF